MELLVSSPVPKCLPGLGVRAVHCLTYTSNKSSQGHQHRLILPPAPAVPLVRWEIQQLRAHFHQALACHCKLMCSNSPAVLTHLVSWYYLRLEISSYFQNHLELEWSNNNTCRILEIQTYCKVVYLMDIWQHPALMVWEKKCWDNRSATTLYISVFLMKNTFLLEPETSVRFSPVLHFQFQCREQVVAAVGTEHQCLGAHHHFRGMEVWEETPSRTAESNADTAPFQGDFLVRCVEQ